MTSPAAHPLELAVIAFDQAPDLGLAVRRLHGHCRGAEGPLRDAPITIVDNGSTDGTWLAAQALAAELDGVATRRTDERLGTKALRGLMADSGADTVAFVRVGPNSDLDTLLAPLSIVPEPPAPAGMTRRSVLTAAAGGAGLLALLAACASSGANTAGSATAVSTTASTTASGATTTPAATGGAVALAAEMTQGPYYLDLNLVRSDIHEDRPGLPLALALTVVDAAGKPVKDATVDIWHCDAAGIYSGFQSASTSSNGGGGPAGAGAGGGPPSGGGPGGPGGQAPAGGQGGPGAGGGVANATQTDNATFLRGTQVSAADGTVAFSTVYPGWYQGRTVHIHVMVHVAGKSVHTGQLFFDDASTDALYAANAPYSTRSARDTRNANDGIYQGGGAGSVLAVAKAGAGLSAKLAMAVKTA